MTAVFCTVAEAKLRAGKNFDTGFTDANFTAAIEEAQSIINGILAPHGDGDEVDLVDAFSGLDANVKEILTAMAKAYAGNEAINYNMNSYYSLAEAQTMLNNNYAVWNDGMEALKKEANLDYLRKLD